MVPMVSSTMMQVTSFVLSGIACILPAEPAPCRGRGFGSDRGGCMGAGMAEGLEAWPVDGELGFLLMAES